MPPRKSDAAKVATGDEGTPSMEKTQVGIPIEDLNLPKSIVTRLAKGVLPANTQIQGNATLALQKSATVFVNHLANAANTYAQRAQRKTIAPQDVFQALEADLEFADFIPRLEAELAKFNEISTEKRNTYRKKVAADKAAGKTGSGDHEDGDGDDTVDEGARDESGQPATKKARRADGDARKGAATRDMEIAEEGGDEIEEEGNEEADEDEDEGEEHFQVEEDALEEPEEKEGVDEALDNGEDSD